MLGNYNVSAYAVWEQEEKKVVHDPAWGLLSAKERRTAYEMFVAAACAISVS